MATQVSRPPSGLTGPHSSTFRYFGASFGSIPGKPAFYGINSIANDFDSPPGFVTFRARGAFTIYTFNEQGAQMRALLNGRATQTVKLSGDLQPETIRISASNRPTTVVLEMSGFYFGGVSGRIARTSGTLGQRVIVLGDSYTQADGAVAPWTGYATQAGFKLGTADIWASGEGGTGYIATDAEKPQSQTIGARLQADALRYKPNTIIVAAGLNDAYQFPNAQIVAAASSVYKRITAAHIKLIVVGPWDPTGQSGTTLGLDTGLRQQAQAAGGKYISPIAGQWIGPSNAAKYLGPDHIHPNQAGYNYLADRLVAAVGRL